MLFISKSPKSQQKYVAPLPSIVSGSTALAEDIFIVTPVSQSITPCSGVIVQAGNYTFELANDSKMCRAADLSRPWDLFLR